MYESPIKVLIENTQMTVTDGIYKAVQDYGITVNKDELMKALQYDRNQYNKGYEDGARELAERLKDECTLETDVSLGYGRPCYEDAVPIIAIDNALKEIVGEQG